MQANIRQRIRACVPRVAQHLDTKRNPNPSQDILPSPPGEKPMRRLSILVAFLSATACEGRPPEFGVSVFSNDTSQVEFRMEVTGRLVLGLRAEQFLPQPDSSLNLVTPAELVVQQGGGRVIVRSVRGGAMVIQPLGIRLDSLTAPADTAAVIGRVVTMENTLGQRKVKLKVDQP